MTQRIEPAPPPRSVNELVRYYDSLREGGAETAEAMGLMLFLIKAMGGEATEPDIDSMVERIGSFAMTYTLLDMVMRGKLDMRINADSGEIEYGAL